jgi:hypothetical protein
MLNVDFEFVRVDQVGLVGSRGREILKNGDRRTAIFRFVVVVVCAKDGFSLDLSE